MKKLFLIFPLAALLFATQGWAPPPGKGGAAGFDASKCDLKPKEQTKVALKDKSGKLIFVCIGSAVCGGKTVPVSCKVSEREACPMAKKCVVSDATGINEYYGILCSDLNRPNAPQKKMFDNIKPEMLKPQVIEIQENKLKEFLKTFKGEKILRDNVIEINLKSGHPYHTEQVSTGKSWNVGERKGAYLPVGKLEVFDKGNPNEYIPCTASLIKVPATGRYGLVTAAHCLMVSHKKIWPKTIKFSLNYNYGDPIILYGTRAIINKGYFTLPGGSFDQFIFDLALVELEETNLKLETFGLITNPNKDILRGTSLGYPIWLPGTGWVKDNMRAVEIKDMEAITSPPPANNIYNYKIPTDLTWGSSGGPWIGWDKKNGSSTNRKFGFILGVNSKGKRGKYVLSPFFGSAMLNQYRCLNRDDSQCKDTCPNR
ncbi:MAG: hypothetical protein DRQ88_00020 [Epsilonproteobacteria bacterium]|nr:MAG: hypothetical protein DRQ88_00020 [Campylobacterota bacterium]